VAAARKFHRDIHQDISDAQTPELPNLRQLGRFFEREKGFEPSTPALARL